MTVALTLIPALLVAQGSISINVGTRRDTSKVEPVTGVPDSVVRVRAARDSARNERRRERAIPMTSEHLATAFTDTDSRRILEAARTARLSQDSLLRGYEAAVYERLTVGLALTRFARERIFLRYERSANVRWEREKGARVEITGERTVAPMLGSAGGVNVDLGGAPPIPYFPGREPLWGAALARANVSDRDIVNPLAGGAEAYYTYSRGDSATFRLPGGLTIKLRELRVRPRAPKWSVLVASLWFDTANGRLVRAVYRMAEPMDIWAVAREEEGEDACDAPKIICAALRPMTANVPVVTVEYGLHEGRFWLPRIQAIEGSARVGIMRVPFKLEQRYTYSSVNSDSPFDPVVLAMADTASDSLSRARRAEVRQRRCGSGEFRDRNVSRFERTLTIAVRVPCDTLALASSPTLPASPFSGDEEVFGSAERDELVSRALALGAQAGFSPQRPVLRAGLSMTRYNRVEGLSSGIAVRQALGAGYAVGAQARIGTGDWEPNGESFVERSNGRSTYTLAGYRRLEASNDWGDPLGFGSSLSGFLFGRDEGFYYRTVGVELRRGSGPLEGNFVMRLFGEHHSDARAETSFSLARTLSGKRFRPNIDALNGDVVGIGFRRFASFGLDPRGFRLVGDLRGEGAAGTFDYSRIAGDFTLSRPLFFGVDGAVTAGAGTSGGELPVQRWWFIGGAHTVRGQPAGEMSGNSFWIGRAELGSSFVLARPVIFADAGWAGERSMFGNPGKPISGAGVGASFLDGLLRFDLAKGIRPNRGVRGYFYLEARF